MRRNFFIFVVLSALLVSGMVVGSDPGRPSPVLLPRGNPVVFGAHEGCAAMTKGCAVCHGKAAASRWASERLVPMMEDCAPCHGAAKDVRIGTPVTMECRVCHSRLAPGTRPIRGDYPRPNVRFSHAAHKGTVSCANCHPRSAGRLPRGPVADVPTMERCYRCHERRPGAAACRTCHIVHKDGRLFLDLEGERLPPPAWLKGPSHGPRWVERHAPAAGADSRYCASCHRESFCQDCHTGKLRPRDVHPGDWMTAHGVSTRLDNPRCRGCHRKQSFCITCHRRTGVAPDSPARAAVRGGSGRYHREMETNQLMRRARRDVTSCVSCHSEGSCLTCHTTVKPHPPGFKRKCKPLANRNRRACAKCHRDDAWRRCQ